jgi:hypothetical protein
MSCYPCNTNCVDQVVGTTSTTTTTTCPDALGYDVVYTTDCVTYTGCNVDCFGIKNCETLTETIEKVVISVNNCLFPPPTTTSTTTTSTTSTTSTTTSTTSTSSTTTTTTQALCSLFDYTLGYDNSSCVKACSNFTDSAGNYYSCCTDLQTDCVIYTNTSRDVQAGFYSNGVDCYETNIDGKIIAITPCVPGTTTSTTTSTSTSTTTTTIPPCDCYRIDNLTDIDNLDYTITDCVTGAPVTYQLNAVQSILRCSRSQVTGDVDLEITKLASCNDPLTDCENGAFQVNIGSVGSSPLFYFNTSYSLYASAPIGNSSYWLGGFQSFTENTSYSSTLMGSFTGVDDPNRVQFDINTGPIACIVYLYVNNILVYTSPTIPANDPGSGFVIPGVAINLNDDVRWQVLPAGGTTTSTTSTSTTSTTTSTTSTTSTTTTTTAAPLGAGVVSWSVSGSGGTYSTVIDKLLPSTSIENATGPTSGSTTGNGDYLVQLSWTGSGTIMQYLVCKSIGALTTTYATFGPTVPGGGSTSISLNVLSGEIYTIYVLYGPGTLAPCSI